VTKGSVDVGVRASFLMHEAVQANIRAGVSSGANTLAWIAFVPLSLLFGWVSRAHGVHTAGWLLVLLAAAHAVRFAEQHIRTR
jgi:hypothetical protein